MRPGRCEDMSESVVCICVYACGYIKFITDYPRTFFGQNILGTTDPRIPVNRPRMSYMYIEDVPYSVISPRTYRNHRGRSSENMVM